MKDFFKMLFASMFGLILAIVALFFIFVGIISAMVSSSEKPKEVVVSSPSILQIHLDYPIKDRTSQNAFKDFNFTSFEAKKELGLNDILKNIKKAKADDNIKGIYLDESSIEAGIATIDEIRNALLDFKTSGKFIISYAEFYTQGAYYLASVSDKIYLNPGGAMEFKGLNYKLTFLKGTLEKLGIEPQIIRHGKFKSAIEPLINDKMSDANRLQASTFINTIWTEITTKVAASRHLTIEQLNKMADENPTPSGEDAVKLGLLDSLKYYDQVLVELKTKMATAKDKDVNFITLNKYNNAPDPIKKDFTRDEIAIIYASGNIVDGESNDEDKIASQNMAKTIREARLDENVKAIVFRVNSGGGSALASEVIWREVALAKAAKPVIVSMGDYAASGGYYISCVADTILANPMTLTGSIGVFGVIPNLKELFTDKLGFTFDGVKTNALSDIGEINRPMTEPEKAIIQKSIEEVYGRFTLRVAGGRKKSQADIDSIGQGRVWTGKDALGIGLVDASGGMEDAIAIAAHMAKLTKYKVTELPRLKDTFEKLFGSMAEEAHVYFSQKELGEANYRYYEKVKNEIQMQGIQARLPFTLEIK